MPEESNPSKEPLTPEASDAAQASAPDAQQDDPTAGAAPTSADADAPVVNEAAGDDAEGATDAPIDESAAVMAAQIADAESAEHEALESVAMPDFGLADEGSQIDASAIDFLADVNLNVKIELGRCRMMVEDVLRLGQGSVVELEKLAGDPVDVFVNERLVARGEVLVLNDNFCVRINEIVASLPAQVAT